MPTIDFDRPVLGGYRQVSWPALVAIVRRVDGVSASAAIAIAQAVWVCVPRHPQGRAVWSRAAESVKALRDWLVFAEPETATGDLLTAIETIASAHEQQSANEAPSVKGEDRPPARRMRAKARGTAPAYAALVTMGVDVLRGEGVPVQSARSARGALEIMADVLYWVWRKPDARAHDLHRTTSSVGAVYWRTKKVQREGRLVLPDSDHLLALAKARETESTKRESVIWIPDRPVAMRGRNS